MKVKPITAAAVAVALSSSVALAGNNPLPSLIIKDSVQKTGYDGVDDDLLSAGLNQEGLESSTPPGFVDPLNPTVAELRRRAIWTNYRAVVDSIPAGGMGLFWGPASGAPSFDAPVVQGLIPGFEYKALMKGIGAAGNLNRVPVAVQIPENFNHETPCILIAPPSGSRGYYGGIAVAEWGLFKGCATVLPGKGTGIGYHLLGDEASEFAVYDINGVAGSADDIGKGAQFRVRDSKKLRHFLEGHPDRVAIKHGHSMSNSENHWGEFAVKGTEFAFWALNDHFGNSHTFRPGNTTVIASGVSNGAGTSLQALEIDKGKLIDGLVVAEPSINPRKDKFVIKFGDDVFDPNGATLLDQIAMMATYAGCAANLEALGEDPIRAPLFGLDPFGNPDGSLENRCTSLHEKGLLTSDNLQDQAAEALAVLRANGFYEEMDWGIPAMVVFRFWRILNPFYAAGYGRLQVWENVCNISTGYTDADGSPAPVPEENAKRLFATTSGLPGDGLNLIADAAANGPIKDDSAISASTGRADLNLDAALCFRFLSTGDASLLDGQAGPRDRRNHRRVRAGARQLQSSGNLGGVPAIIITGREDLLVFTNQQSRAYHALNQARRAGKSNLMYWEVTPGQHFESLISTVWLDSVEGARFVPLNYYHNQALDKMYDHLTNGVALPPSQVVRATARGNTSFFDLTEAEIEELMPEPKLNPGDDAITFAGGVLTVPK